MNPEKIKQLRDLVIELYYDCAEYALPYRSCLFESLSDDMPGDLETLKGIIECATVPVFVYESDDGGEPFVFGNLEVVYLVEQYKTKEDFVKKARSLASKMQKVYFLESLQNGEIV